MAFELSVVTETVSFQFGTAGLSNCVLVYSVTNTAIQIVAYLLHWGLFGTLSVQLCASFSLS